MKIGLSLIPLDGDLLVDLAHDLHVLTEHLELDWLLQGGAPHPDFAEESGMSHFSGLAEDVFCFVGPWRRLTATFRHGIAEEGLLSSVSQSPDEPYSPYFTHGYMKVLLPTNRMR